MEANSKVQYGSKKFQNILLRSQQQRESKNQERNNDQTQEVIAAQLEAVIATAGIESFQNSIIAYEPVWAIGTGQTASPEQAQNVHEYIRTVITKYSQDCANDIRILYGGSVNAKNAKSIFSMPDIDGGLIGGASLNAKDFLTICESIQMS